MKAQREEMTITAAEKARYNPMASILYNYYQASKAFIEIAK